MPLADYSRNPLAWASVAAMAAVIGRFLVSGLSVTWSGRTITFGVLDAGLVAALLTPTLTAYVASRHSSMRDKDGNGIPDDEETGPPKGK